MLVLRSFLFNTLFYTVTLIEMIVFTPYFFLAPRRKAWFVPKFWARTHLWLMKVVVGTDHVVILGTGGSSLGGQALVEVLRARGLRPSIAVIGEPTLMHIVEAHKGCCEYTAEFTGLEGHGSDPDAGVNAAEYAVRYVSRLLELRQALIERAPSNSPFHPPWTTINLGKIAGGVAHNVIAGKAEVEWEMRPVQQADADFVKEEITRYVEEELLPVMRAVHPGADISTQVIGEVVGLEPMPGNAARALVAQLTGRDEAETVPFGTEAGLFQSLGMSAVVCGPGSIAQAHKPDEFVSLDQLDACLNMLAGLTPMLKAVPRSA